MPYTEAAVCKNGHPASLNAAQGIVPAHCRRCGEKVLARCLHCAAPIPGPVLDAARTHPLSLVVVVDDVDYTPPRTCDGCSRPYPWAQSPRRRARGA